MTPSLRLIQLLGLLMLPALLAAWYPDLGSVWKAGAALLLMLALLDLLGLRRVPTLKVARKLHTTIPVGVWTDVQIELENRADRNLQVTLHDHHPPDCEVRDQPQTLNLPAQRQVSLDYRILPRSRGEKSFAGV
ncbi:MAG: hypothetical protein ABW108_12560, partial [Candidatus Thiodiazotropha sp. 6PLUC10]